MDFRIKKDCSFPFITNITIMSPTAKRDMIYGWLRVYSPEHLFSSLNYRQALYLTINEKVMNEFTKWIKLFPKWNLK